MNRRDAIRAGLIAAGLTALDPARVIAGALAPAPGAVIAIDDAGAGDFLMESVRFYNHNAEPAPVRFTIERGGELLFATIVDNVPPIHPRSPEQIVTDSTRYVGASEVRVLTALLLGKGDTVRLWGAPETIMVLDGWQSRPREVFRNTYYARST